MPADCTLSSTHHTTPKGNVLMVVGTSSHAGKSTLVAALCRIFTRRGLRVAPFKAQNMSLNSAVTLDGAEIGRAQMLQAQAARVIASADMNPVLLKPQGDSTSQIVVLGKAQAVRHVREYYAMRDQLWPTITGALDRLRAVNDLVIIEGAGSPAEINLRDRDMANMRVALHANAPVLLVGDIERGGVFASLAGTVMLLSDDERALVKGFVINKFRGDVTLIEPGPSMLFDRTGVKTLGVLPYFFDVDLPEEDSLGIDGKHSTSAEAQLDVAIVRLPHMANFDDFDPLRRDPRLRVRYVGDADQLGDPNFIIIPGSKTTIADLGWMRTVGLADRIIAHSRAGAAILGICGGFQMLGRSLRDPKHIESDETCVNGLGLLEIDTEFFPAKTTHQARAQITASHGLFSQCAGLDVDGYEIHMGGTSAQSSDSISRIVQRSGLMADTADGAIDEHGWIAGTYLHGLFHNAELRERLLQTLAARCNVMLSPAPDVPDVDAELDKLANIVEQHLDVAFIEQLINV